MLSLAHVSKSFGRTRAVDDVSLELQGGEVVGLVGENGAGKTTLMRIVAGELAADRGAIARPPSIGFVHQHFMLVSELSIAENLALGCVIPSRQRGEGSPAGRGFLATLGMTLTTRRSLERAAEATIAASGIALQGVARRVGELSVGEQSKVELIKAIARRPELLILDEPTSVLAPAEANELFAVMRRLAADGTIVVFISHKIPEVLAVATRFVVMRQGQIVAQGAHMTADDLAEAMVARRRLAGWPGGVPPPEKKGEILAIIGVAGNGQTELAEKLRQEAGPRPRVAAIPEDRTRDGLVAEMSIAENVALLDRHWNRKRALQRAARLIDLYDVRAQSPRQRAGSLSGGNQQKIILARELDRDPDVVVASEPTRGLDIEATRFVHDRLRAAAARGARIVLLTSDLDEAFALADAVQVIYRGKLSERMTPAEAAERAPRLMAGLS